MDYKKKYLKYKSKYLNIKKILGGAGSLPNKKPKNNPSSAPEDTRRASRNSNTSQAYTQLSGTRNMQLHTTRRTIDPPTSRTLVLSPLTPGGVREAPRPKGWR